jgi:kinesin family protein C1
MSTVRRPLSARSLNDENCDPEDHLNNKGSLVRRTWSTRSLNDGNNDTGKVRRPLSARSLNEVDIRSDRNKFQKQRPMSSSRSVPALVKPVADAPLAQAPESSQPVIDVPAAIAALRLSLASNSVELASLLSDMLGDTGDLQQMLQNRPAVRKPVSPANSDKLMEYQKRMRMTVSQHLKRRSAFADALGSIQAEIDAHLRTKESEIDAQRVAKEKAAEEWERQKEGFENDLKMKLEIAAQIRDELSKQHERREAELSSLAEARHHELAQVIAKFEATRQELSTSREENSGLRAMLTAKAEQIEEAHKATQQVTQEKKALEVEFQSYKEHHGTSNQQQMTAIAELKVMVSTLSETVDSTKLEVAAKESTATQQRTDIEALKQQLLEEEQKRREMHNALQELKGNIRVCCRARPASEGSDSAMLISNAANRLAISVNGESYNFDFDKVFDGSAEQETVFSEVSELVQSALDGYKVCIFAYGQTGSGKTHTMQGAGEPSTWGVIPRSLRQIIQTADTMRAKGWTWSFQASFLEVYNESLRDLLHDSADGPAPAHTIVHDNAWGSIVTNMTVVDVTSMEEIRVLMATAARQRSVGNTDMNSQSSRSHAVFALYLQGTNRELNTELCGALHLVDLAGSERLGKSGAEGCRLKETQNINRSLSSLADVFLAKAENRNHVPFRNSKLTHLLEPCLSGHGKTLMMVNVAPEQSHAHETLCSLRFANQVSQCNTGGKPKRTVKTTNNGQKPGSSRPQTPTSRQATPR